MHGTTIKIENELLRGADKSLTWPGRKQANVSVRMAWISFGALPCRGTAWRQLGTEGVTAPWDSGLYRGADKSLARPGRKQANVSVRMAWISFGALPCWGTAWRQLGTEGVTAPWDGGLYRGADKSLARPGPKQANVSVKMAWISFSDLPCKGENVMTARVSMLLKSRASLRCFRACFIPGRAKDLSAPR